MRDITLQQAHLILQQCSAVMLEDRVLEFNLLHIEEDESNEFGYLAWREEYRGEEVDLQVAFAEGDNKTCILDGCELTMVNTDGEEETLVLLREFYPEDID